MATDDQDKTEQPTPFRLQEARGRGQVPRSADFAGVVVVVVFSIALIAASYGTAAAIARAMTRTLLLAGNAPSPSAGLWGWLQHAFQPVWQSLLPVGLAMLVAAVLANLIQTGPNFSVTPLKPDFSRLNPVQGAQRLFSLRVVWELFKLLLKLGLLATVGCLVIPGIVQHMQAVAVGAPASVGMVLRAVYVKVTTWVLVLLGLVALFDLWFSRREYMRKLRMSRRDIKDEVKRREGDPAIRSKRRRLMSELLKSSRSVQRVPEADVVLTNPTHLAVALKYRPRSMRSPVVLAKGSDAVAARMRMSAAQAGVPLLRSPELARALYKSCKIDQAVPQDLYKTLAPVYRWLMKRPGNRIFS
ncbi:EscU/YscU/HrcU family type III secretion system export apparatus switch protein [Dyella sp.]|uniref:EscU/YscU/HrcU family type III secretion system export apparatus switch protein n=1 Tax=Dyella sp. TaxID=1869338 RepID=UPI002ED0E634